MKYMKRKDKKNKEKIIAMKCNPVKRAKNRSDG